MRLRRFLRRFFGFLFVVLLVTIVAALALLVHEARTSYFQAHFISRFAKGIFWHMEKGESEQIRFPTGGPSDERRGYVMIPHFAKSLLSKGFGVEEQSHFSPLMLRLADYGIYPSFHDKFQTGLQIEDRHGSALFQIRYPTTAYPTFDSIPALVWKTLLYIENKSILDPEKPYLNPAVEWGRFGKAAVDFGRAKVLGMDVDVAGGSTLATQLEKYKHSNEGRTTKPQDKLLQMTSATLRTYQRGPKTLAARKDVVLEYINTVPLAALPGYGEVNGLGDGIWAWYGTPFDTLNKRLSRPSGGRLSEAGVDSGVDLRVLGRTYRQVLNLFIAHRRPSYYLLENREALRQVGDAYLKLMARDGVIPPQLRDAALGAEPELMRRASVLPPVAFVERKAINAIRTHLLGMLDLPRLYDLDRLDLRVESSLDRAAQEGVTRVLRRLRDSAYVDSVKLKAFRMLERGNPAHVIYSFTLYENSGGRNLIRVQADNYDQPLNINSGAKLDLGSTAKLRTLVNYLEIVAGLHQAHAGRTKKELQAVKAPGPDKIMAWSLDYLASAKDTSLKAMLEAALDRRYSASPGERFFTGGGSHTFVNFNSEDNGKILTMRESLRNSVNLPFIRLMRDIVNHYMYQIPGATAILLDSGDAPERQRYLTRFAEKEGTVFLARYYRKYKGKGPEEIEETFFHGIRPTARRLTHAYLSLKPQSTLTEFGRFLRRQTGDSSVSQKAVEDLYKQFFIDNYDLSDRSYAAGVHPLELWVVSYLLLHPNAPWGEVKAASLPEMRNVYRWLFTTRHRHAQDLRIKSILEMEAFFEVHRAWQRLGYPFGSLVPSYATAIGSSADRPAALAELAGILVNDGVRYSSQFVDHLHFAEKTPYHTVFKRSDTTSEQVLPPVLAQVVRSAMLDVVEKGTAVRGYKAFLLPDGSYIPLGGKTGTGDHRFEVFGAGGRVLESRVVNRTATFAFFIGDRFFGTATAHVHGERAESYGFTSSLPVQVVRLLVPSLLPLVTGVRNYPQDWTPAATEGFAVSTAPGGGKASSSAEPSAARTDSVNKQNSLR